ncbi:zinc finger protein ZAT9-like [Gastrolobium bilobum]|uniref:zinc finger protein ZAT9-like n=1 Tax=Gastrolobium bilobum TaxID=150636 RepID=UPI002AB25C87|nr:zinc finger protein ZAT9-like [Gastrolobium bilobum]
MERHKCKLCFRTFANGRALGGHMKAHMATLPLPPKPEPLYDDSASLSFSSSEDEEQEEALSHRESDEKALIYGLRENPKKSFRLADPEFSFPTDTGGSVVVQDRESETESKNPTRRRSKRTRKINLGQNLEPKKAKLSFMESPPPPPPMEPEPVSSVSDASPDEDVAMCLMMLSRDQWKRKRNIVEEEEEEEVQRSVEKSKGLEEVKLRRIKGKQQCQKCGKTFRSSRALGSHKSICLRDEAEAASAGNDKIFECPFCYKVFGSGQALGGHKRSHIVASSSSTANDSTRLKKSFIDLNLPAPAEDYDDDLSAVSDA